LSIYPDDSDKQFTLDDFSKGGYQKIPENFSGVYHFYRRNGSFIGGWRVKDGVKTHRIKRLKSIEQSEENSRVSSFSVKCYQIETTWYQYSCSANFGCTTPEPIGTTLGAVECELVLAPSGSGDNGGGGSSSGGGTPDPTDPTDDCEVPEMNLEGLTIDCEDLNEEDAWAYLEARFRPLNDCEKEVIGNNLNLIGDIIQIFNNHVLAEEMTAALYSSVNWKVHNNCADAFRHAYWNAANTISANLALSTSFTMAHECSGYNFKEQNMDRHNNAAGIDVGIQNMHLNIDISNDKFTLASKVQTSMRNGNMVILFPRAIDNSVLLTSEIVSSDGYCQ